MIREKDTAQSFKLGIVRDRSRRKVGTTRRSIFFLSYTRTLSLSLYLSLILIIRERHRARHSICRLQYMSSIDRRMKSTGSSVAT